MDPVEDAVPEPAAEALGSAAGQPHIFVHVEGRDAGPVDPPRGGERFQEFVLRGGRRENDRDRLFRQQFLQLARDRFARRAAQTGAVDVDPGVQLLHFHDPDGIVHRFAPQSRSRSKALYTTARHDP